MAEHAQAPDQQADTTLPQYPHKNMGRPTTYTPATAQLIAARLADGETLSSICRTPGMPHRQTVQMWRMRMADFDTLYLRARAIGMEAVSDDALMIADDDTLDVLPDGTPNPTSVNRARLQVHARHFLMGKLARSVYGDKVEVQHSGNVEHTVSVGDRERMRRLATFLAEDQVSGALIDGTAADVTTPELADPGLAEGAAPVSQTEQTHHEDDI